MYEAFFQLRERPFASVPASECYFPAAPIEHARQSLRRVIDRSEGSALVVGPSGTGKSLLLQVIASDFRERLKSVLIASGRMSTSRALLQAILFELNLPYRHMDESELRLSLVDHLSSAKLASEGILLLIDEAQGMSWRLLEELRMLTNLTRNAVPSVRIVMAGGPKLEERFASPRMDSFAQRLAVRCYLEAFTNDETSAYIEFQLKRAGGNPARIFPQQASSAVYRETNGIPRLVNQLCDHALLMASLGGCRQLGSNVIEEAWADLQQLPAPWNSTEAPLAVGTRVIEFGGLSDCDDDLPNAIPFPAGNREALRPESDAVSPSSPLDPAQQLDRLEAQLQQLDDDTHTVVSIRPEVELVFQGGSHPFGEEFTEEEVVLDRYASLEANVFERRPAVSCAEGQELSALLEPHTRHAAESVVPMAGGAKTQVLADHRVEALDIDEDFDDADLIVIEDELHAAVSSPPAPLVRKQEYRQLFAKLRRG